MSLFGGKPAIPAPKPAPKPGLFEGGRQVPVKELFKQAALPKVIPETGGQKIYGGAHKELLKKYLPHKQVGTYLRLEEAKAILRKMRHEDKGMPSRDRRIFEADTGLKGKY